jgi:ATP-dependent DNA helicase RecG
MGKIIDRNYTQLLMDNATIPLNTVILLDRVQKKEPITDEDAKALKAEKLIEGRKPNYFVAAHIADAIGNRATYIKNKAFDDDHYIRLIEKFIKQFGSATRKDIDELLLNKLSDVLNETQKLSKIGNLLTTLRKKNIIKNAGSFKKPIWVLNT